MRKRTSLIIPIGLVLLLGVALADNESDRRGITSQIQSKLDSAASKLSNLESKSGTGDIDDAQGNVRDVERLVEDLKRVQNGDSSAEKIVASYPNHIRDFCLATDELRKLKNRQDKAGEYVRQCKAFDDAMIAKANEGKDDPRSAEELSDFAKSVGRKGEELLSDASRNLSEVERSRDDVKRFSPSDGWSNVRSTAHGSADAIVRIWREAVDNAKRACEEVVKRERHRDVERALGKLAGSRAGRADLRKRIDELLVTVSDKIKDVQSQSGASNVHGAIEITKELESQLERLKNAAGDDGDSRRISATWPAWVRELRVALEALHEMKTNQHRADDGAGRCEAAERTLQERIRREVSDPTSHEQAIRELPVEADRVGVPIRNGIEKASEVDRQMDNWLGRARAPGHSDGSWSRVTANLRDSAGRVHTHWNDKFSAMKKSCERIMLGKDHPDVRRAVEEMGRDTKSAGDSYRSLRDEFNRWKVDVDRLRDWSEKDLEDVRAAFCKAPDAGEYQEANRIADRWASQIKALYGSVLGQADRIKRLADDLVAKGRARKNGPKVKEAVDAILVTLEKLKHNQNEGSNSPLFKAQSEFGVEEHEKLQASLQCTKKELVIKSDYCRNAVRSGSDCRLDCLKECTIIEIKPDNKEAKDMGERQVEAYMEGLRKMFAMHGEKMFTGDFSTLQSCISSDKKKLELKVKVESYSFCPKKSDLGPTIPAINVEIPERAE